MTAQSKGKAIYKRVWFWLAIVVVLYALAGFVALPWWLERTLPERAAQHLGWQTTVADVSVNPFAMTVEITGLDAVDGEQLTVVAFDRFYIDLEVLRLVTGVIAFDDIELDEPTIRLDLLPDYSVNFTNDWVANNPPSPEPESAPETVDESPAPPKLYFSAIRINGGSLIFRDFSQTQPAEFQVVPLDLELSDIATYSRDGDASGYTLNAVLGDQELHWQGSLSVHPLHSRGHLRIANLGYDTIGHFIQDLVPYRLAGGAVTVESDYELAGGGDFSLVTTNGSLAINNLAVTLPGQDEEPKLALQSLSVADIRFSLLERLAGTGTVKVEGLDLKASRLGDGQIDWLVPLPAGTEDGADEGSDAGDGGFRWNVAGIELSDSAVAWRDEQLDTPAELTLQGLQLTLGELSQQLDEPVSYQLATALAGGGRLTATGQATPQPFTLEAGVTVTELALAQFEPYVQAGANLSINGGALSVNGDLDLDGQSQPLTGTFSGSAELASLDLASSTDGGQLLKWQRLALAPIEYNIAPARLEIGTVTLTQPWTGVTRLQSGEFNVAKIGKDGEEDAESPQENAGDTGEAPEFVFRVGEFVIEDGTLVYTDRGVNPVFTTDLRSLEGMITGISNVAPQEGTVALQGIVGEAGSLNAEGQLAAIGGEDTSSLKIDLERLSLPMLSPYFGQYLGYGVDSGKMTMALDYQFTGSHLVAENLVTFDRLELGARVESEDAVTAPIKLGLALLRDTDGRIEIDVPVEGDLGDPNFRIGRVIMRAFVNLMVKAAASPFNMLGSVAELAGFSAEELGVVAFVPGTADMVAGEAEKLEVLAKALSERNDLLLNVRGAASPDLDGLALKRPALYRRLGVSPDDSVERRIEVLAQALTEDQGAEALAALGPQPEGSDEDRERWLTALEQALVEPMNLPPEALGNLAAARGRLLQRQLLDEYEIPADQLFLREPQLNATADDGRVTVEFSLGAH